MMDEQQLQFDVYYQGTSQQLLGLLYPLGGPNSHVFQHLEQQKVTLNSTTKQLTYSYTPQQFDNIDKQREQIKYISKPVHSLSNYFYSVFDDNLECFVWRNLTKFVEMRPQNRKHDETKTDKTTANKRMTEKPVTHQIGIIQPQPPVQIQLEVIESGSPLNIAEKEISQAPVTQVKPLWHCSKDEYFSFLAN